MKFKCNNYTYEIIELDNEELKKQWKELFPSSNSDVHFGYTDFLHQVIAINKDMHKEHQTRTLIHELTHCWLNCYGHAYADYDEEDVCETVANIHDFINEILRQYEAYKEECKIEGIN